MSGQSNLLSQMETTCGSLLTELQIIWDEVGETETERDRTIMELERECLELYRRKVDQANNNRAQIRQAIADAEAELAVICAAMGEMPVHLRQSDQSTGSLKTELRAILPQIEEMRKRKFERKKQFIEVVEEIRRIKNEIYSSESCVFNDMAVNETDLTLRKLEELHMELQALQKEKSERLKQVLEHLNDLYSLCSVLGLDFKQTVSEIHPTLCESDCPRNINNDTIEKLGISIDRLRKVKIQKMQQLQDLGTSLLELWNLMDTPVEEQMVFQKVTCNIAASEDEITEPGMLSVDMINYVKAEVSRLEEFKASRMKMLVLKKKAELEDICRKSHLIPESYNTLDIAIEAIESGSVDASSVLEQIELQISRAKEDALSRKEILEKVEKWMGACEEESWLEEYNRDENRYNAGRGAHLTLKRAEKARALVNKLPAMVDTLTAKTLAWEKENGTAFSYDGVGLLDMLEGYAALREEKELERKRQRDQKKLLGQLLTEKEAIYGSKPSPSPMKNQSVKKGSRLSSAGGASNRRLSLGGAKIRTPKPDMHSSSAKATPNTRNAQKTDRTNQDYRRDDGFAGLSSGRRGLDLAGLPMNQHAFNIPNARETDSPMTRKPFSPITSTDSSKSNISNILEDLNRKHDNLQKALLTSNKNTTPFTTPTKRIQFNPSTEQENRMPQTMIIPVTPSTVSIPMQTAITPAPLVGKLVEEEIESSFEERRAGFVIPRSHLTSVIRT